jgi:hypothetical protein
MQSALIKSVLDWRAEVKAMSTLISDRSKTSVQLYALEQKWMTENREKYAGQWVALVGDCLLSHGMDAKAVYEEARAKAAEFGDALPLVVLMEKEPDLPFGGW